MATDPSRPAVGAKVIRLRTTSSTIDEARTLADQGAPHGTVVLADRQTAGRGRRGRVWYTLPGKSLAATVVLRDLPGPAHVGMAGMAGALAVVSAIQTWLGLRLSTRWPNDVLHDGKKLAGTLAETARGALLLSIGLNINGTEADLPADLRASATTLQTALGRPVDRRELTARVLADLDRRWNQLLSRPHELAREWEKLDVTVGALIRIVEASGASTEARGLGIDAAGRLRIRTPAGAIRTLSAGDATLL